MFPVHSVNCCLSEEIANIQVRETSASFQAFFVACCFIVSHGCYDKDASLWSHMPWYKSVIYHSVRYLRDITYTYFLSFECSELGGCVAIILLLFKDISQLNLQTMKMVMFSSFNFNFRRFLRMHG